MISKKLIVGNWKMNPTSWRDAKALHANIKKAVGKMRTSVVLCLPAPYLGALAVGKTSRQPAWGAQDLAVDWEGAQTGAVSAPMLASVGADYVIVGHSERRAAGETSEVINRKLKLALRAKLRPILCVGESERDEHGDYLAVVQGQLHEALDGISKEQLKKIIIAYEPVWAIGKNATGVDTPEAFRHNRVFIRKVLASSKGAFAATTPVLYGGSVSLRNATSFLLEGEADGLLIGRESLNPKNFAAIVKQADALK